MTVRPAVAVALVLTLALAGVSPPVSPAAPVEEPTQHTLTVNGVSLHYQLLGEGPPLLLLHYFGGCGDTWAPHLARFAEDYRVIVPDLRGHGRSTAGTGAFTHAQAARDIGALLDHLELSRVSAIGASSGGMTLLHLATTQPQRLDALVLVGAAAYWPAQARALMRRVPAELSERERQEWGRCSTRGDAQTDALLAQFHDFKDSYADMNLTAPLLSTITARTLIVHGDRDAYFPAAQAVEMYQAIPGAALWIVPYGTHLPLFGDDVPRFQAEVLTFLAARPAAR